MNISNVISEKISGIDWHRITEIINERGYALVLQFLPAQYCEELIHEYDNSHLYRKTITMERHGFGLGEYKYFKYPLPDLIQTIRTEIYPKLAPVANTWMKVLNIERQFPNNFDELQRLCHENNQTKPTVLILKYGKGGHNTLHQDLYGDIFSLFNWLYS
ncbi:MAG TPA: 2OG-Fe(II) oxygenase [Nitrososphaeraceae archaeon]|nr:2OG-Fe(II) oxygenase [Nitrososphaeraceae archaeon]